MNAAFGGRAPIGYVSLQISGVWRSSSNHVEQEVYQEGMEVVTAFKQALGGNVSCYSFYNELQVW